MTHAYIRAMDKLGVAPVFDPQFQATFLAGGLEAALRELDERDELDPEEREAVQATLDRLQVEVTAG